MIGKDNGPLDDMKMLDGGELQKMKKWWIYHPCIRIFNEIEMGLVMGVSGD